MFRKAPKISDIDTSKLGVVLVDMQPRFIDELYTDEAEERIKAQKKVLRICQSLGFPVAVLEFYHNLPTIPELQKEIDKVPLNTTFKKHHDNGFTNPHLLPALQSWGLEHLCFMGINAPFCVKATAESALKNFSIVTAPQLIAAQTYRQGAYIESLKWYEQNGAYSDNVSDVLTMMRA